MSSDGSGLWDEAVAELNPSTADAEDAEDARPGVQRPADSAAKAAWVDHVVSLGADRATVSGSSQHWDDEAQEYVAAPELSKGELVELANRLGG